RELPTSDLLAAAPHGLAPGRTPLRVNRVAHFGAELTVADAAELEVIAIHGWGYSGDAWRRWADSFTSVAAFRSFDRGYFGAPTEVGWRDHALGEHSSPPPTRILLLHSMAPLFVPSALMSRADLVVLFGGFERFHPDAPD